MNALILLVIVSQVQMPSEFLGEPKTVEQIPLGGEYWVPADCLVVDHLAKGWLIGGYYLNKKSDHLIRVTRVRHQPLGNDSHIIFRVIISKKQLNGWRWKRIKFDPFRDKRFNYIPVGDVIVED